MSTNVRVGPGVYLLLKHISEELGITIGGAANLLVVGSMISIGDEPILKSLPNDIQTAVMADIFVAAGDLIKKYGMDRLSKSSIAELYQQLLNPSKSPGLA